MTVAPEHQARAEQIKLLVLDVDGVLTDGALWYGEQGECIKRFHVRDGLGVKLLQSQGITVAVISARGNAALQRRLNELDIEHAYLVQKDKMAAIEELAGDLKVTADELAYAGDDLIDLPPLRYAGLGIAVADAHPRLRKEAQWVTQARGGEGAVREIAEGLLAACDRLEPAFEAYLNERGGSLSPARSS